MFNYVNIMDLDIKGKKVLMRVDINSSIDLEKMEIRSDPRIQAIAPDVKALKETALCIIAHQSRKGKKDFISLKIHAERLQTYLDEQTVKFVPDHYGEEAKTAIQELKPGEVLVLENIRMWDFETKKGVSLEEQEQSELVQNLAPLFDYFVNDAFGAAHRQQVSLVGWPHIAAGPLVAKELEMVKKLMSPEKPCVWLVGGAKAIDKYQALKYNLEKDTIDTALVAGLTANMLHAAKGTDIGEQNTKLIQEDLDANRADIEATLEKYGDKILLPVDLAVEEDGERKEYPIEEIKEKGLMTGDLGQQSIAKFKEVLLNAKTIVSNGPPGIFEKEVFKKSSFDLVDTMADAAGKGAFVVIGGGEMGSVAKMADKGDKIIISTGGGALLEILSGKQVPLLQVLEKKPPK